jgi:hypothetical protein
MLRGSGRGAVEKRQRMRDTGVGAASAAGERPRSSGVAAEDAGERRLMQGRGSGAMEEP